MLTPVTAFSARPHHSSTQSPPLYQARLDAAADAAASIGDLLEAAECPPAVSVSLFETAPGRYEVSALYAAEPDRQMLMQLVRSVLGENGADGASALQIAKLPDADWVTLSQGKRGKVEAGRFLIHGSHDRPAPGRGVIEIDAGRAFGTGHHASTKACLLALDAVLKRQSPRSVLDIGTGSGVLAIAAARFLRGPVVAADSDPVALAVAEDNARKNRVPGIRFLACDGFGHPALSRFKADLVFGNLLQSILLDLAPGFARHTAPGGLAILSGLAEAQAARVEARFRSLGFTAKRRILLDGWTTLVLRRLSRVTLSD
jgi:ribosomal protein L11 methyltransferase